MRRSLSNFSNKGGINEKAITFEDLCVDYRKKLVEQLMLDQDSKNKFALKQLVDRLLPDSNFYCFKIDDDFSE